MDKFMFPMIGKMIAEHVLLCSMVLPVEDIPFAQHPMQELTQRMHISGSRNIV